MFDIQQSVWRSSGQLVQYSVILMYTHKWSYSDGADMISP